MADSHDKKSGFSLGKTFAKVAKYAAVGAFSFFILGGLDFVFFHELGVGTPLINAMKPVGEALFLTDIPIFNASITDGVTSLANLFMDVVPPEVSTASVFTEAYTDLPAPAFSLP